MKAEWEQTRGRVAFHSAFCLHPSAFENLTISRNLLAFASITGLNRAKGVRMLGFTGIGRIIGALAVLCAISLTGCQNKLQDENVALWQQNRELQSQLTDANSRLRSAPDPAQLASMQTEIAQRDAQIADLKTQLQKPAPGAPADPSLAGIEVTRDERAGTMTVTLPGDVLFSPGKADLKESAKTTLDKVIDAVNKDYAGKNILVDGYTDSDPINKTKGKWTDNLDLSAARARAVTQYLVSQGVSTHIVSPRAFGSTNSKATKDASRRVEIVVATR
jgi:outer membrane protein OmpA-like peptidoglycan-associated protein